MTSPQQVQQQEAAQPADDSQQPAQQNQQQPMQDADEVLAEGGSHDLARTFSKLPEALITLADELAVRRPPSAEDARHLRVRDQFILDYVGGRTLGHADWVKQLRSIPANVDERNHFDRMYFRTVYELLKLFQCKWER